MALKRYKSILKEDGLGKKEFYQMDNVGSAKYTINFHDGKKTHKDGSPFYDMKIFKNKKDLYDFVGELIKQGYVYDKSPIYK